MAEIMSKKEKLFEKYISESKVLVVDASAVSRSRLVRLLKDVGAKDENITSIASYHEALGIMDSENPRVVLSDYKLKGGSGFDLLRTYRERHEKEIDSKEYLFILITSNSSQSMVAKAAEEDVDSFILKPYTIDILKNTMINTAIEKLFPSPYVQAVEAGKELLFAGKPEESLEYFNKAKGLHPRPTLACFYIGQADMMIDSVDQAEGSFKEGLGHNKIHYKCLVSLFDLLCSLKRLEEAYDIVKVLSKFFPANPDRLASVVRLAVQTNNFRDIEEYYNIFITLEERTEELLTYVCAGLVVSGRYFFQKGESERAIMVFNKLGRTTAGNAKFLRIAIENLVEYGQLQVVDDFLSRFHDDDRNSDNFKIAKYIATQHSLTASEAISAGMEFIGRGLHNYGIYLVVIKRAIQARRNDQAAKLLEQALELWPDKVSLLDLKNATFSDRPSI